MRAGPHSLDSVVALLESGKVSSRQLVEDCLGAAHDPAGEGGRVFTRLYDESARREADKLDACRRPGKSLGLLDGLPISVKDLFDVAGEPTPAGSTLLADAPPATKDAKAITRLRNAGAVLIGRTNMTEFAFSGLGLNPHYGTPRNPWMREEGRIPGGSSSGAAVSVTDGMALAAIGSDTGGSVRIPAALCGLTGFKPTARRIPLEGVLPLSPSLDSIGWIAPTVACCARINAVLSDEAYRLPESIDLRELRIGILQGYVLDGLDGEVADRFEAAIQTLSCAGAQLFDAHFDALSEIPELNSKGGFPAAEAYVWHRNLIEQNAAQYDSRVLSRILRGKEMSAVDYMDLQHARRRIIRNAAACFTTCNVWIMPTVPRVAPCIAELELSEEAYFAANAVMLRNPAVINFLDGCALSIPCHRRGEAPIGLMLAAPAGHDAELLRAGSVIEECLARNVGPMNKH